jgi:hypothetical protein
MQLLELVEKGALPGMCKHRGELRNPGARGMLPYRIAAWTADLLRLAMCFIDASPLQSQSPLLPSWAESHRRWSLSMKILLRPSSNATWSVALAACSF